jgi:pyridoxamine 5'-phosphate oxidase
VPDYSQPFLEQDADPDPLRQFGRWFEDASSAGIRIPEAMAVATASVSGVPSVRIVLMKQYDECGFVFYTRYTSDKGRELEANPHAALLFYWIRWGARCGSAAPWSAPRERNRTATFALAREGAS